jgi:outer membrane immunogenic protein
MVFGLNADFMLMSQPNSHSWDNDGSIDTHRTSTSTVSFNDSSISAQAEETLNGSNNFQGELSVAPTWLSTLRATMGVAQDRALFFVSGGFAFGRVNTSFDANYSDNIHYSCTGSSASESYGSVSTDCPATNANFASEANWHENKSENRIGFALGGGVAYAMTDNMILKLDGLYYNLGTVKVTAHGTGTTTTTIDGISDGGVSTPVADINISQKVDGALARVSVAYKFN